MLSHVAHIPDLPGIYLFKNALNEVIYIGKAKSLKKRVSSYFQKRNSDWKIKALIDEHTTIEHIVTHSETEALLLEAQLIREHKPKYNVLLKTGQPFLYILFTQEELHRVELVRNKQQKGTYFGPFLYKRQARSAYQYIIETFKLTWCNQKIDHGCLKFHLGLCAGTCKKDFNADDYLFRIELAKKLLQGNYRESLKSLQEEIKKQSAELAFEKARILYEYLQNLETIFTTLKARFSETKYQKEVLIAVSDQKVLPEAPTESSLRLQTLLHLTQAPRTIDCFDISHFQGKEIVGSCIRFTDGKPDKNNFRRFKIRTLQEQNDYAALQEIVGRRYKDAANLPDLVLIDGGKGQLSAVKQIIPQAECISIAKREERIFCDAYPDGIVLDQKSPEGHLLIALRDYAHHFAINYHRMRRKKNFEGTNHE